MIAILAPVSAGELVDKITILRLKAERITDPARLANVRHELELLEAVAARDLPPDDLLRGLTGELQHINGQLWTIEDDIRDCEARADFGPGFIALARAVYRTNDRRADVKRRINLAVGSPVVEEKSYTGYARGNGE